MKRTFAPLIISLLIAPSAWSQDKPTVEQCRADFSAWKSTTDADRDGLSVRELQRRFGEMTDCTEVEGKDWERKERYFNVAEVYGDAISARYLKFLIRHKLLQQFLDEDAAGQR